MNGLYALYDGDELVCVASTRDGLEPGKDAHRRRLAVSGTPRNWRVVWLPMVVHPGWMRSAREVLA